MKRKDMIQKNLMSFGIMLRFVYIIHYYLRCLRNYKKIVTSYNLVIILEIKNSHTMKPISCENMLNQWFNKPGTNPLYNQSLLTFVSNYNCGIDMFCIQ